MKTKKVSRKVKKEDETVTMILFFFLVVWGTWFVTVLSSEFINYDHSFGAVISGGVVYQTAGDYYSYLEYLKAKERKESTICSKYQMNTIDELPAMCLTYFKTK